MDQLSGGGSVKFYFKKVGGMQHAPEDAWASIVFSADRSTYTGQWSGYNIEGKRQNQGTPTQAVPEDKDSGDPEESSNQ